MYEKYQPSMYSFADSSVICIGEEGRVKPTTESDGLIDRFIRVCMTTAKASMFSRSRVCPSRSVMDAILCSEKKASPELPTKTS